MYKELLEYIVKNLVSSPDKIEISENNSSVGMFVRDVYNNKGTR